MPTGHLNLFLDTNSLLHYPPIKDIDWCQVCDAESVNLILCLQVINELDGKKDDSRLGDRARKRIKEIQKLNSGDKSVRDGVTIEVFNQPLRASDFPDTLSIDEKDDRIVHLVLKYSENHAHSNIHVCTEDYGMSLRCEAHSINVIVPPMQSRLEDPQSVQDKKYKEAIAQLNDLKNRLPRINLVVSSADAQSPQRIPLKFELNTNIEPMDVDTQLREYRERRSLAPMQSTDLAGNTRSELPSEHDAITQYNREFAEHLEKYRNWLEKSRIREIAEAHTVRFSLWLVNEGLAPGERIDVDIDFDDIFASLCDEESEEAKAIGPSQPPRAPKRPNQRFVDRLSLGSALAVGRPFKFDPAVLDRLHKPLPSVSARPDGGYRVHLHTHELKHHESLNFGVLLATLKPSAVRPFEMRYRISAANVPDLVEGTIPVIVKATRG